MRKLSTILAAGGLLAAWSNPACAGLVFGELFGVNSGTGGDFLVRIDKATGGITTIGNTGTTIDGLAFSASNVLFAADNLNRRLITLDPFTGALDSVIGNYSFNLVVEGLTFRPSDGSLWGIDVSADTLIRIDANDASIVTIGSFGGPSTMAGLSWSVDGSTLYGTDWSSGGLYAIDPGTGLASIIGFGEAGATGGPLGLATDPTNGVLFAAEWRGGADMTLATVSVVDGSRTHVGTMFGAQQIEGLSFVVPGPGAVALLAVAGLGGFRRRRDG